MLLPEARELIRDWDETIFNVREDSIITITV